MSYNIVASSNESTVVAEYKPTDVRSDSYQSEAELEHEFIRLLSSQSYDYLAIRSESELISNLKTQLEKLNDYKFSDNEWKTFFKNNISNSNESIVDKTKKIQANHVQNLKCDNGQTKNIYLLDKKNIHNNSLQVINQYEESEGSHNT